MSEKTRIRKQGGKREGQTRRRHREEARIEQGKESKERGGKQRRGKEGEEVPAERHIKHALSPTPAGL